MAVKRAKIVPPVAPPVAIVPAVDPMAAALAGDVQTGHGADAAALMELAEEIGEPRYWIGTRNIALDRALGNRGGLPAGRIVEISGWEGAGKSTVLDQIIAEAQSRGGIAALADTERQRDRPYMIRLGVDPRRLIWIAARTVEEIFAEFETVVRGYASAAALAWQQALVRAGQRCPACSTESYAIYAADADRNARPRASFAHHVWGTAQKAALLDWQRAQGLHPSGQRDAASREILRPVVLYGTESEQEEALAAWIAGTPHPYAISADRPLVLGWDTVAGTPSVRELAGDAYDEHVSEAAKAIKRNFRRLVQRFDESAVLLVLVNQRYEKIDMGGFPGRRGGGGGRNSETYGGGGIKYHSAVRIELERAAALWRSASDKEAGAPPIGHLADIRISKLKQASPGRHERFALIYGRGAENAWALYEDLKERGVIGVAGGWSKITDPSLMEAEPGGQRSWQGGWMGLSDLLASPDYPGLWGKLWALYMEGA